MEFEAFYSRPPCSVSCGQRTPAGGKSRYECARPMLAGERYVCHTCRAPNAKPYPSPLLAASARLERIHVQHSKHSIACTTLDGIDVARFHTLPIRHFAGDVLAYLLEPTWALLLGVYVASAAENPPKAAARGERQCVGSTGTVPKNSGTWAPLSARSGGMYCRRSIQHV